MEASTTRASRSEGMRAQIQVRFLAGSLARLGKLVKSLGSNPSVSRFESGAAHQRGYSSIGEQPAFNRLVAASNPARGANKIRGLDVKNLTL